jgi:hypothetical protein
VHFSFKGFVLSLVLVASGTLATFAQDTPPGIPRPASTPNPQATPPEKQITPPIGIAVQPTPQQGKQSKADKNAPPKQFTAEQVVEGSILIYGGRGGWSRIGKTAFERGKLVITAADGTTDNATYEKRIVRGDDVEKDKWRLDEKFPSVEFALIYNTKIFGLLNDQVFTPRQDAIAGFESQMYHGLDTLIRYKENGSTLVLGEKHKSLGVEYYTVDVTDKSNRKTTFYISVRTLRVMWLEFTENSVKYTRRYYDYRYAQGLLVPYRTVLLHGDAQIEEGTMSTVTFGQKVEDSYFSES